MPTYSTAILDMTSSATSGQHVSKFAKWPKMSQPTALGIISPEWFKQGTQNFTDTYRGRSALETCRIWHHSLHPVSCKLDQGLDSIVRSQFDGWSPVMTLNAAEILKLSGMAFCLTPPVGLLVKQKCKISKFILESFWFDLIGKWVWYLKHGICVFVGCVLY